MEHVKRNYKGPFSVVKVKLYSYYCTCTAPTHYGAGNWGCSGRLNVVVKPFMSLGNAVDVPGY